MIKNIIFDFGNVLFDLELGRTGQQLRDHLGEFYDVTYEKMARKHIFELYEVGGLSTDEFLQTIVHDSGNRVSSELVMEAWNSILLGMPAHRFPFLLNLRQQYRVFLLSNINEMHAEFIQNYLKDSHGIEDFETRYFDGVYYSHLIRLRKPMREIFEYVLADAELIAEECLFIDDVEANILAARSVGLKARQHTPGVEIVNAMEGYLQNVNFF